MGQKDEGCAADQVSDRIFTVPNIISLIRLCLVPIFLVLLFNGYDLMATFLFARSSPRCHAWIVSTKVYRTYVAAFKEAGGIPAATKVRILTVSFVLMGASAFFVRKPFVWIVLGCVALFLLYLMLVRIPTISLENVRAARKADEAE